jgi:hypothetical protein
MTPRQRFHAVMDFQPFDRLPVLEWCTWWYVTIDRWHTEGLPASLSNCQDIYRYFGLDVTYYVHHGVRLPASKSYGAPIVESAAEYEELRKTIYPNAPVKKDLWAGLVPQQEKGDVILQLGLNGPFHHPRELFGIEPHMYAFYDHPDLMHRMIEDLLVYNLRVIDQVCSVATPDFMSFAEDLSYNHGSMLSKDLFDEFLAPYYRRIIPELHKHGIKAIVDSDGDISVPAAWYRDVGADGMLPLERQAGCDMAEMRRKYPTMRFIGHYDKMVMPRGEEAMRAEFERLLPIAAQGGFLPSMDHQTPPGVSFEQYKTYIRLFHEYADKAGQLSQRSLATPLAPPLRNQNSC